MSRRRARDAPSGGDAALAVNAVADAAAETGGVRSEISGERGWRRVRGPREWVAGRPRVLRDPRAAPLNGGGLRHWGRRGQREAVPDGCSLLSALRRHCKLRSAPASPSRTCRGGPGGGARTDVDRRQLVALESSLGGATRIRTRSSPDDVSRLTTGCCATRRPSSTGELDRRPRGGPHGHRRRPRRGRAVRASSAATVSSPRPRRCARRRDAAPLQDLCDTHTGGRGSNGAPAGGAESRVSTALRLRSWEPCSRVYRGCARRRRRATRCA